MLTDFENSFTIGNRNELSTKDIFLKNRCAAAWQINF